MICREELRDPECSETSRATEVKSPVGAILRCFFMLDAAGVTSGICCNNLVMVWVHDELKI